MNIRRPLGQLELGVLPGGPATPPGRYQEPHGQRPSGLACLAATNLYVGLACSVVLTADPAGCQVLMAPHLHSALTKKD